MLGRHGLRPLLLLLGLVLLACAACSGDSRSGSGGPAKPLSAPERTEPQRLTRELTVDGRRRTYFLDIPTSSEAGTPTPVILALHPGFATARGFAQTTRLTERAVAAGFAVVYPEGYGRSWNAGDCCGPAQREGVDDIGFVTALLEDLRSVLNFDRQRVFVTGFSNGAKLAYRLACERSERIAAIATAGGANSLSTQSCNLARPVSLMHFHGLADQYSPFHGGLNRLRRAGVQPSIPETIAHWVRANGCSDQTKVIHTEGPVTRIEYRGCRQEATVTLWTIAAMGHQWPGGKVVMPRVWGPGSDSISATDLTVQFFRQQLSSGRP
jgi:polyhydroxybutyrate depolymerase